MVKMKRRGTPEGREYVRWCHECKPGHYFRTEKRCARKCPDTWSDYYKRHANARRRRIFPREPGYGD